MTLKYEKVSDYILVKNLIPSDVCEKIIGKLETLPWEKHEWYNSYENKFVSNQEQESKEFDVIHGDYEVHCTLIPYIKKICEEYEDTYRFNYGVSTSQLVRKFSVVRYNRYRTGQKIVSHYDHIHSIFDGKEQGIPILSLIGVFNDNYQGGKLTFWQNHEVELKQGDIVAFPSLFMYPHEVTEITEGTRYSWVSWCY